MADGYNGDHPGGNYQIVIGQLHPEALSLFLGFYFLCFAFFLPRADAHMTVTKVCDAPFTMPGGGPSLQIIPSPHLPQTFPLFSVFPGSGLPRGPPPYPWPRLPPVAQTGSGAHTPPLSHLLHNISLGWGACVCVCGCGCGSVCVCFDCSCMALWPCSCISLGWDGGGG